MKIRNFYIIFLSFLMSMLTKATDLNYDEARRLGGFQSVRLSEAQRIEPSGCTLSENEKLDLVLSEHLNKVHTLNLANQGINDEFIRQLSTHSNLARIINLDLSGNPKITMKSIDFILESDILGSSRDLPQISGRFGIPSSTIYINARNTGVVPPQGATNYFEKHRSDFSIDHDHFQSQPGGMKFVEVMLR